MTSTYLRLAAPLQSWATSRVTGNVVRTESVPTTDGLKGLVAASLGAFRGEWPEWIQSLDFTIRVERKGELVDEFQTINPRDEDQEYQRRIFILLTGKRWGKSTNFTPDGQYLTSIVSRTYLGDAEFLVEISSPNHHEEVANALKNPRFTPYLGRKAFAPTFPYFLGIGQKGLLSELPSLKRTATGGSETVTKRLVTHGEHRSVTVPELPYEEWLTTIRKYCVIP